MGHVHWLVMAYSVMLRLMDNMSHGSYTMGYSGMLRRINNICVMDHMHRVVVAYSVMLIPLDKIWITIMCIGL